MGRKEYTYKSAGDVVTGGCHTIVSDEEGRSAVGWGNTPEESRENAYKHFREKYK